jgi:hypothetical protein
LEEKEEEEWRQGGGGWFIDNQRPRKRETERTKDMYVNTL